LIQKSKVVTFKSSSTSAVLKQKLNLSTINSKDYVLKLCW